jgi:CheY-like chemotaxis protein
VAGGKETTVFIVEDDPSLQELYQEVLSSDGLRIVGVAGDGNLALQQFAAMAEMPDLVILDHRLPGKCGLDVSAELAKNFPQVKILFVSADAAISSAAISAGATRFVAKPFLLSDLFFAIQEVLEKER